MKKLMSFILIFAIVASMLAAPTVLADKDIAVELDGKTIDFDVKPEIIDGRTMVPLRKIFEEIGAFVKWDNDSQTVSARKNSKTITLVIGSADLQLDKGKTDEAGNSIVETVALDVPATVVSGRTLVPARAISESFGLDVEWDEENNKVIITSNEDEDDTWKENTGAINLDNMTYDGKGIEISDNQIKITSGGDYTLKGTLEEGNITISTNEKVRLRLSGVKITSSNNPCVYFENADKAYITLSDGTENYLVAKNSEDGAIYSKENLEIKGGGNLEIDSVNGHGIKASDNLNIENGAIKINATSDGIHINDTFKMTGGAVNIVAIGDGIDCESIVDISGGIINIETNGVPFETEQPATESTQQMSFGRMWEETADVEFEKSTKGINAEWMMKISGGEFNINSASHTIHCQDEIEITGGIFTLSSKYDKGISAHGNITINGEDTVIDVTKSTEGIESKKIMTINNGVIKVISADDAINATGGNTGMMVHDENFGVDRLPPEVFERAPRPGNGKFIPPFERPENGEFVPPDADGQIPQRPPMDGNFGGMERNMKECLVINGGYFELCGGDDCIDANGNISINGGTIKASNTVGTFFGNFGVIDSDGQTVISENAEIILASGMGNERVLELSQNTITVYFGNQHSEGEKISVTDGSGNTVYEYVPECNFKAVLIASKNIKTGDKYMIIAGNEAFEVEITDQSTVAGTQPNRMGVGRGQRMQ